jgi:Secretion system C-terminal sorting domain
MKRIFIVLLFLINTSYAQFFELSFEDTIGQIDPQNHSLLLAGYLKNVSSETLDFKMVRLQNNLPVPPPIWSSAICLGLCVSSSVDSISTRDFSLAVLPGDSILTEVVFAQYDSVPGVATVQIKYATLDDSQIEIQWFEAHTLLNNINNESAIYAKEFKVLDNYPNPFNNQTTISAVIDKPSKIKLQIYDILGREVFSTFKVFSSSGEIKIRWNGKNNNGVELSSGIYFYRISAPSTGITIQSENKKLTLLR